ncbi:type I-C CRISPR-associated protein Cas7/Csd2 [Faecalicatena contorta]|mgnify:FL=1|uniref:type I-C CRISPR-associated protein Cas7/Csd2 n=1 Tax=Clostridia TaxID=186801 RepID=UPI001105DA43|nr:MULTISPECIES: type I-C CRISPR-associated protein Cas7/Csd2 [Clostridia]MBM6686125.1 type I-C CRISPR-associated protein Cas7/Csd2 [Faecalicatena contorta]MBM6711513.1 type I-C CRISPR-associated protein Cas7/Csd2 [Faecalicatena contorta]
MALSNRYDFVMLFDVENGNPNGDPDAGNAPRVDAESGYGYITDVCLKRKIRNYVELVKEGAEGYNILIKPDKSLNIKFTEAYEAEGLTTKNKGKNPDDVKKAREYMCKNYFDVRTFGAVMSTGDDPCGIVRGPVQINFARSISPVNIQDVTITRQARTTEERKETGETEMGRKSVIPYALYRAEGYVSAALANKSTDLSEEDVELLWNAIINMFENDHSAARGKMCMRKLYVFRHNNILGACPSHILFDKISVREKENVLPRAFGDYDIVLDENMPAGVELIQKL